MNEIESNEYKMAAMRYGSCCYVCAGTTSVHAWTSRAVRSVCRRCPVFVNLIAAATSTRTRDSLSPSRSPMSSDTSACVIHFLFTVSAAVVVGLL